MELVFQLFNDGKFIDNFDDYQTALKESKKYKYPRIHKQRKYIFK